MRAIGIFLGGIILIMGLWTLIKPDSERGGGNSFQSPAVTAAASASVRDDAKIKTADLIKAGFITHIEGEKVYVSAMWYDLNLQQKQQFGACVRDASSSGHITVLDDHSGKTLAKTSPYSVDIVGAD